ncbi:hypothetical protein P7K49_002026 [Saguinus oedipus]|uniref:Sulfhydryl oxidase n=1 Tax=Saguinus oedipus TaxID=9490 RepID=A0ABQ9WGM7_SAGOE|nr:hypothetical protein P7K49_002026 [Saguinus oedipus]
MCFEDDPQAVLQTVRRYIRTFFGCKECGEHFEEMAKESMDSVKTPDQAILWLWRKHNVVNGRLAGEKRLGVGSQHGRSGLGWPGAARATAVPTLLLSLGFQMVLLLWGGSWALVDMGVALSSRCTLGYPTNPEGKWVFSAPSLPAGAWGMWPQAPVSGGFVPWVSSVSASPPWQPLRCCHPQSSLHFSEPSTLRQWDQDPRQACLDLEALLLPVACWRPSLLVPPLPPS